MSRQWFGDSIAAIEPDEDRLHVRFERAQPREFDLVIGADALHSRVREIAFGSGTPVEFPLGYHVAAFEAVGYRPRDELVSVSHSLPGRQISRFALRGDRTLFLFVLRDERLARNFGAARDRKALLAAAFADAGWEWPAIHAAMHAAGDLYFDSGCSASPTSRTIS